MPTYEEWLSAMPVEEIDRRTAELEGRVAELEAELEGLRTLRKLRPAGQGVKSPVGQAATQASSDPEAPKKSRAGRVTPERQRIIDAIGVGLRGKSAQQVADELRSRGIDITETSIGANMARMAKFGLLERVEQGRYRLPGQPPATASLLNGHGGGEGAYEP